VYDLWGQWGQVVVASALGLPAAATFAAVRSRWVGWRLAVAEVAAVAGTVPWVWMVLTPRDTFRNLHLLPLYELGWYLGLDPWTATVQLGGNLAVLAAFGAAAPVRWRLSLPVVAALAAAGSVAIEMLQYVLDIGRTASVDDVLLNTTGAVLAALLTRRWWAGRDRAGRPGSPPPPAEVPPAEVPPEPAGDRPPPAAPPGGPRSEEPALGGDHREQRSGEQGGPERQRGAPAGPAQDEQPHGDRTVDHMR